jgi:hypothetical protein
MSGFNLQRLGMLMEPEPGNLHEIEGVLNPAAARGPDGELYLFPRLVARGNYSRIGIARVRFNDAGDSVGVERLGIALEPEAEYERRPDGSGGCEDPRITFVEPLQRYVMTTRHFRREARGSPGQFRKTSSTGSAWGCRRFLRIMASIPARWMTKTPAYSLLPFRTHPGNRSSRSSTGPCFPELVRRKPPAAPRPVKWTLIARVSGFPTARFPWSPVDLVTSASFLITGWRLQSLPGSGSKSAAALRPS